MVKTGWDAGHGLATAGKRIPKQLDSKETREWTLNSRVVEKVLSKLKDYEGITNIRLDDPTGKRDIPLAERARKANDNKVDLVFSVHHNAGIKLGTGGGIVVYRFPNSSKFTKSMQKDLYNRLIKHTGLKGNRANPLAEANFQILRQTNAPAVLLENGFMDSRVDAPIILTDGHAEKTANAIVEFVVNHFKLKKKPKPTQEKPKTDGYFRVVVGSYKDRKNAEEQQKKLKKAGFDSFLSYYEK